MTRKLATLRRLPIAAAAILMAVECDFLFRSELACAVTVAPGGTGAIGIQNVGNFFPTADDILQIEFDGVTTQGVDFDSSKRHEHRQSGRPTRSQANQRLRSEPRQSVRLSRRGRAN